MRHQSISRARISRAGSSAMILLLARPRPVLGASYGDARPRALTIERAGRPRRLGACNRCPIGTGAYRWSASWKPVAPHGCRQLPGIHLSGILQCCNSALSPSREMGRLKPAHTHEHVDERHVSILGQPRPRRRGTPGIDRFRPHRFQCAPSLSRQLEDRDRRPVKVGISYAKTAPCEIGSATRRRGPGPPPACGPDRGLQSNLVSGADTRWPGVRCERQVPRGLRRQCGR